MSENLDNLETLTTQRRRRFAGGLISITAGIALMKAGVEHSENLALELIGYAVFGGGVVSCASAIELDKRVTDGENDLRTLLTQVDRDGH